MTTYKQARVHKKKRINKKWLRRYGMRIVDDMETVYFMYDKIYMSQGLYNKFKKEIQTISEHALKEQMQIH